MQRFCFQSISSLFAVVQNQIQLATAILFGSKVLKRIFLFNSLLFQSLRLLNRVSNCCLYYRLTQNLSFLFKIFTISKSIQKASLRQTSQQFFSKSYCQLGERSSLDRYLISSKPKQRQKNNFSLHQKRYFCIRVSQIEGRYILLYCLQQSQILFLILFDFQFIAKIRSFDTYLTFLSQLDGFFIFGFWIIFCLFLMDYALLISIYSLSLYYFQSCSLKILKTDQWLIRLSFLLWTTSRSTAYTSSQFLDGQGLSELMDWKLGTDDMTGLLFQMSKLS